MVTIKERVESILKNREIDFDKDTIEKLVWIAYYMGMEKGVINLSDRYRELLHQQLERAKNCRYYKMAIDVQGNVGYLYDSNYSANITNEFACDLTAL